MPTVLAERLPWSHTTSSARHRCRDRAPERAATVPPAGRGSDSSSGANVVLTHVLPALWLHGTDYATGIAGRLGSPRQTRSGTGSRLVERSISHYEKNELLHEVRGDPGPSTGFEHRQPVATAADLSHLAHLTRTVRVCGVAHSSWSIRAEHRRLGLACGQRGIGSSVRGLIQSSDLSFHSSLISAAPPVAMRQFPETRVPTHAHETLAAVIG
jgi:hypothetical protein